jgi:hypothetical protein
MKCRGGPRKGTTLECPKCNQLLDRDTIIIALYNTGIPYSDLGRTFNLSKVTIGRIVAKWAESKPLEAGGSPHRG